MPEDQDQCDQVKGEGGPEAGGLIHVSTQCEQGQSDPEAVFNQEIIKLHGAR